MTRREKADERLAAELSYWETRAGTDNPFTTTHYRDDRREARR